ncbi:MAG TPA: MaoC family dehydratase N-terminal domain-containing protein [Burkholderiaceae bacterium]|jgi:acyl dehydratase
MAMILTPIGQLRPALTEPFTSAHLVRWCAAQQNWDKIHYDADYAREFGGLSERVVNGALKQHLLARFLTDAFDASARIVRLNYKFAGPDFVGEQLELRGRVVRVESANDRRFANVELEIWNPIQAKATTSGSAIMLLDTPSWQAADWERLPAAWRLDESVEPGDGAVPEAVRALLGRDDEQVTSFCALDASRLRLFADALTGLRAWHYDPRAAAAAGLAGIVAPDLFPIHSIEPEPGALPLSQERIAMGREAVSEVGRNFARRFGFPGNGMVNGGNETEIHSPLRLGETACATSRLVSARVKAGARGGDMLFTTSLNTYRTTTGRLLMREKQLIIYRNFNAAASAAR